VLTDIYRWAKGYSNAGKEDIVNRVAEIAKKHNVSMAQIALAWTFVKDSVSAPIIGTTSVEKLLDLIGTRISVPFVLKHDADAQVCAL
jgi:aryl-alcohol dehydrogenase-like predicted oxidoreductase